MNKIKIIFIFLGLLLLCIYMIMNITQVTALLVICIPFLIAGILEKINLDKIKKEIKEMISLFQREKEEVVKEIKRKENRLKEQFEQLTVFSKDLSTALNKEQLLYIIVSMFAKATRSVSGDSQCFLLVSEEANNEFVYEVGSNFDSSMLASTKFKKTNEMLETVVTTKKISTYISDIFAGDSSIRYFLKEERFSYMAQLGSLALVPLVLEEEVWGIIVIFCQEEAATRIKNEEIYFLLLVAQASIALGSAIHRGLASVDKLTQLYNRVFLQKRMMEEIEFCNRQQLPLSLMMIDIDHFKMVNDMYGHQEGDMVLKNIAHIINKGVRLTDVCARYGGEEFVVLLPGIAESSKDKFSIAERLRVAVEQTEFVILEKRRIKLTISIGVMVRRYPEDKELTMEELITKADAMLYKAKNEGRNKVCYYNE